MKHSITILILTVTSLLAEPTWQLIWNDEFQYEGIPDSAKWSFDTDGNAWDWGNNELQNYTKADNKNAWVENGSLIIEARKERNTAETDGETKEYSSARLRTIHKGDWIQGRYEIRAKLPTGTGTWPAIWMLPTDETYGGWPHSGEIDIMEAIGSEPTTHYSTVWTTSTEATWGKGDTLTVTGRGEEFHTYAMEWYEDSLRFFVDNKQVHAYYREGTDPKQWPFDRRFHLLMNIAVGGDWEKNVNPASFPARLEVDYVRIYQLQHEPIANAPGLIHGAVWMKQIQNGIVFRQSEGSFAELSILTDSGKVISTQELGFIEAGEHEIPCPKLLTKGTYFARLTTSDGVGEMTISVQ